MSADDLDDLDGLDGFDELQKFLDPDRDVNKFNPYERSEAFKLKQAWKTQGLPEKFSDMGAHIRRDKSSGKVLISNKAKQMCMLNEGRIEIYYRCPKCLNEGFKNDLSHGSRCDEILW